jgi:galactose mutarotase-like enzyme
MPVVTYAVIAYQGKVDQHVSGRVTLGTGSAEAVIDPAAGGRIAALRVDGLDLLRTTGPQPPAWGCFPMAPWAGRLGNGALNWLGTEHHFPTDAAPPHALHGLVVWQSWKLVEADETRAVLSIDLAEPWPFGGRVIHTIGLEPSRLTAELRVEAGDRPMPVIAGWHPWFVRVLRDASGSAVGHPLELDLCAGGMLVRGPDHLPTGEVVRALTPEPWDDCFVDMRRAPRVRWPGVLEARVESDAPYCVVYTEPTEFVCIEPQSGPPNGLNSGLYAVAVPGSPFQVSMAISWKRLR